MGSDDYLAHHWLVIYFSYSLKHSKVQKLPATVK